MFGFYETGDLLTVVDELPKDRLIGFLQIRTVRREQLVKLDHLPLLLRVPSLPGDLPPGQCVHLAIDSIDLLAPELTCRFVRLLGEANPAEAVEEDEA